MKLTICIYQEQVALPDVLNWIADKAERNLIRDMSVSKKNEYRIDLCNKNRRIIETVYIVPDSTFENFQGILLAAVENTKIKSKKFIYIGAFRKEYIDDIYAFYKKHFN